MVKCSAYLCENTTYGNIPGLTFHRFPKDQTLCDIWVANMQIKNWKPSKTCVLCSQHFEEHFIDKSPFRTRLRPGAVPTLFENLPELSEVADHIHHEKKMTLIASTSIAADVPPEPLLFCRGCLVTGVRLFDLQSTELKTIFEEFVGKTRVGEASYWLCACCAMLLDKFTQFRDRCRRAEDLMWNLWNEKLLNAHTVKSIDRTYHKLNLNLATSKPTYIGTDTILVDYEEMTSRKRKHMGYEEEEEIKVKEDKQNLDEKEHVKLKKGEHIPSIPLGEERHINLKEGEDIIIKEEVSVKLEQEDHMQLDEEGQIQLEEGGNIQLEEQEHIQCKDGKRLNVGGEEQIQFEEEEHVHSEEEEDITIKEEDYITIEEEEPLNFDAEDGA
ncbi:hypothetical protein evm_000229 [Chilo suppressalis]|nr:hypothetical protein evm_000229 [Chilo suppressalis]